MVDKIGSGAYGHVWKVKSYETSKQYALKKIFGAFQNTEDAQRTYREVTLLKKLDHPNIIKVFEVIEGKNNLDLYLVLEYQESDLYNAIKEVVLNKVHQKYIVYQIAKCLKYLHNSGVVHRDIKPSNILLD